MPHILKKIITGVLWLLSALPLCLLYLLSRVVALLLLHLLQYRKKVVMQNLQRAFPEKKPKTLRTIARHFYYNLADIIIETVKLRHLSNTQLEKHVILRNREVLDPYFQARRSFIIVTGHLGNWEWIGKRISIAWPLDGIVLTKPLKDPFFEHYMTEILRKSHISGQIIPYKQAFRHLIRNKEHFSYTLILGDQTPTRGEIQFWTPFLHQDTPFFTGTEKIAKTLNMPVVFMRVYHPRKGLYEVEFEVITDNPTPTAEHDITHTHIRMLEQHIQAYPELWLWSHKRWKHKMREGEKRSE